MNSFEMEKKLAENGFNAKDIAILKRYQEKDHTSYLVLLRQLKMRFIFTSSILAVLLVIWAITYFVASPQSFVSFSITMVIFFGIAYFITPLRMASKAFFFLRRN